MTGLLPSTRYYYKVGAASGGFSPTFSFKTLSSQAGEPGTPLRIGFVADMGYANHSDDTVHALSELVRNGSIDLMVHNGDVSYADGDFGHWVSRER
jgi:phosphodiesterase/alkaline phosphatase D-like protein